MNREATDLAGVRHIAHDTLGSTNAEALALARAGERGPLWITAAQQSAGRGRRGQEWVSPRGNLYAPLLLAEPSAAEVAPQLSFVAALAVHDAIAECAPALGPGLSLYWPNDLVLGGALWIFTLKSGVNCAHHPGDTPYPATELAAAGAHVTPEGLFAALARAMERRLTQWARGAGFAATRADWLKRAAGLGETIRVRLPERDLSGRFGGLDDTGRLLLGMDGTTMSVTAGEVFGFGDN